MNWSEHDRADELARIIGSLAGSDVSIYEVIEEAERIHDVSPTEVEQALEEALKNGLVYHRGPRTKVSSIK